MWKGLKKALGKPGKAKKCSLDRYAVDSSTRSTSSAAHGSIVFPLDLADDDALAAWVEQQHRTEQEQQLPRLRSDGAGPDPLTASQIQQQLQQQLVVQQLAGRTDDYSTSKRQAAALQKRIDNQMLDPATCLYQISSLLSLSTLFEHKLQRDTMTALRQVPGVLINKVAAAAAIADVQQQHDCNRHGDQQLQPECEHSGGSACSNTSSCCGCTRTPSTTAASTAHVALQLARWGYRVIVRKVLHSKAYWTKAMDNTFIVALDTSSGSHVEYVVDPHFKETFNVGVMSSNYSAVWHSLPEVFVGMPCQLQPVVQLLCEEVELSFLEAGRPCPPWREWAATINRWMSDQYVDILVPEPDAADEEVVEFITRCCQFNNVAANANGVSGVSTTSTSTTSTCSPVNLNQHRLQDKMHVSSVLSSASTSSKRQVPEPLHKQLGFDAVMEDEKSQSLLPATLRDASFTSVTSDASAESVQMLTEAHAAAKAAEAAKRPQVAIARSLSIPSAEILSSSGSSAASGGCLAEDFAMTAAPAAVHVQRRQQEQQAAPHNSHDGAAMCAGAKQQQRVSAQQQQHKGEQVTAEQVGASSSARGGRSDGTSNMQSTEAGQQHKKPLTKSLLTAHMQLKAQIQQQELQQRSLAFPPVAAVNLHQQLPFAPQLQQLHTVAAQQPQQLHQQHLLQQLQLQQQQMLHQHMALHQIQQQNMVYPQQLALLQQQFAQPVQQAALQQQTQQQLVAPLLPVVHTVRPCGIAPAAAPVTAAMAGVNELQQQRQQHPQQPKQVYAVPQLHAMHGSVQQQQQQPRLLRLIQRTK